MAENRHQYLVIHHKAQSSSFIFPINQALKCQMPAKKKKKKKAEQKHYNVKTIEPGVSKKPVIVATYDQQPRVPQRFITNCL